MSAAGENGSALEPSIHAVSFRIGEEELGVDILLIQEINRPMKTAGVPNAPHFVDGLANLRGRVVPILDLRKMLGAACRAPDAHTRVMILNLDGKVAGFRVDAVLEVVRIPPADIDPAPAGSRSAYCLDGVARVGGRLITLLNPRKLLARYGLGAPEAMAA